MTGARAGVAGTGLLWWDGHAYLARRRRLPRLAMNRHAFFLALLSALPRLTGLGADVVPGGRAALAGGSAPSSRVVEGRQGEGGPAQEAGSRGGLQAHAQPQHHLALHQPLRQLVAAFVALEQASHLPPRVRRELYVRAGTRSPPASARSRPRWRRRRSRTSGPTFHCARTPSADVRLRRAKRKSERFMGCFARFSCCAVQEHVLSPPGRETERGVFFPGSAARPFPPHPVPLPQGEGTHAEPSSHEGSNRLRARASALGVQKEAGHPPPL